MLARRHGMSAVAGIIVSAFALTAIALMGIG
jgi:hypothetical protein